MTALVAPDLSRWQPWAAMVEDFDGPDEMHGSGYWHLDGDPVPTRAGCAAFVTMTEATSTADLDGTRVPSTYFWIAAHDGAPGDDLVGFLHLRHTLNEWLFEQGGHIGYSVRPAARRRGHASRALALGVSAAARLGIDRVLVTCDVGNDASRRTIEAGGGRCEDERQGKLRFWIPCDGPTAG
jgi:predicted acetyltransferase